MFGKKISAENLRERREKGTFSQREIARSVCVIAVFHVQMQCKGPVKQISTRPLIISFSNSMYEWAIVDLATPLDDIVFMW